MSSRDVRKKSLSRELLIRAAIVTAVFIGLHVFGCRRFTSCLCGTLEAEGVMRYLSAFLGLMYVLFYMLFTIVVPVLILAAGLLCARRRLLCEACGQDGKEARERFATKMHKEAQKEERGRDNPTNLKSQISN